MPRIPQLAAALTMIATTALGQTPPPLPDRAELEAALQAFDVPGVAMAVLEGCEPAGVVTAGLADLDTGRPVTPDTAFEAASLTKPVFAVLVLGLVDAGIVDLDRPVAKDLDWPRIEDAEAYAEITPRMILTHRTGLPNWVDEATDYHDRTAPIPLLSPPGEAFTYSGEAFQLLQAHVEALTGQSVQTLFKDRLGEVMPNSTLERPLPESVAPSRGYTAASDPDSGRDMTNLMDRPMVASSLVTTAGDYARFLSHVCRGADLAPDTYADMIRPQSPAGTDHGLTTDWGLGWMLVDMGAGTLLGHTGRNTEYNAFAGILLGTGEGLTLFTNGERGGAMIEALLLPPG